jgi:hypothetical protein
LELSGRRIHQALADELGPLAADEAFHDTAHLIPVIGQICKSGRGVIGTSKKLDAVLAAVKKEALVIHNGIFINVAINSTLYLTNKLILPSKRDVSEWLQHYRDDLEYCRTVGIGPLATLMCMPGRYSDMFSCCGIG